MKNIIFEGNTGSGKTTIIRTLKEYYEKKNIKVGITNDMDERSPYYEILNSMYNNSANMTLKNDFPTSLSETFLQLADLTYSMERIKSENNEVNLFDRYIFSVLAYQEVLIKKDYKDTKIFMKKLEKCLEEIMLDIDLIFYFKLNFINCIKRTEEREKRKISGKEKKIFKEFDINLEKLTFEFAKKNNIPLYIIDSENLEKNQEKAIKILKEMEEKNEVMGGIVQRGYCRI